MPAATRLDTTVVATLTADGKVASKATSTGSVGSFVEWYDYGSYGLLANRDVPHDRPVQRLQHRFQHQHDHLRRQRPLVMTAIIEATGNSMIPAFAASITAVITLVAVVFLRETEGLPLRDE